jgi:hypothetical protein
MMTGVKRNDDSGRLLIVANDDETNDSSNVICLVVPKARRAHGVPGSIIHKQLEAMLVNHGIDFTCTSTRSDFKMITYLVQGMMDRVAGNTASDRCLMLDLLHLTFAHEEPVCNNETQQLFGDLLGRLD